jgi:uncharacterized oxidoreductase
MKLSNQKILITGGGTGIGFAIAKLLHGLGNDVLICSRKPQNLQKAARQTPGIKYTVCDITNEAHIKNLIEIVYREIGGITMLINNAGIASFYDMNNGTMYSNARREIETNYLGLIHLTETFLPILKQQHEAAIINISSATAIVPHQRIPTYSASKAAVQLFGESLRRALSESSVKIFNVLAPLVDTAFSKEQFGVKKISPEAVAQALIKGLRRNVYEIYVDDVKALHLIHRLVPNVAQRIMDKRIQSQ